MFLNVAEKKLSVLDRKHIAVQSYIDSLYKDIKLDDMSLHNNKDHNTRYGEIYYLSFVKMLKTLQLNANDVFLDLGSGLGKLLLQTYFLTNAKAVYGVELHKNRYKQSKNKIKQVKEELPNLFSAERQLVLLGQNFFDSNCEDVTVIYTSSTMFSAELLLQIGTKINTMPNVRIVATLRKIPNLDNVSLNKIIHLEGSWDTNVCYIYQRNS